MLPLGSKAVHEEAPYVNKALFYGACSFELLRWRRAAADAECAMLRRGAARGGAGGRPGGDRKDPAVACHRAGDGEVRAQRVRARPEKGR